MAHSRRALPPPHCELLRAVARGQLPWCFRLDALGAAGPVLHARTPTFRWKDGRARSTIRSGTDPLVMFILPRESQAGRSCDDFQVCEIRMELGSVDGSDSFMST